MPVATVNHVAPTSWPPAVKAAQTATARSDSSVHLT
jgi:hypothetical protein